MSKKTSELVKDLRDCERFESYCQDNRDELLTESVADRLNAIVAEKDLKKSEIIKRSELSETYGYQIFAGKRHPERDKLLCIVLGMDLELDEIQDLLRKCGYPQLYAREKRDAALIYALTHRLTVIETNDMLERGGMGAIL